ncbi:MAG: hypothetical protein VKI42_05815 [Synechococcaceae cyanobacterium]|nr:hypothetical protein [Synechococcaceae cyanobacterium]
MSTANAIEWVRSIQLPFGGQHEVATSDWQQLATSYHRVIPLRAFEPLREGGAFQHRHGFLQVGSVKAVASAHSGLRLQGERTNAGEASLRMSLVGRARVQHRGQELLLGPGRLMFDCDDNSDYTARTGSQMMMVVLSLEPAAIAAAAAALIGHQEDPEPFLRRLPDQLLLTEDKRSTGIVSRQILRVLQLADRGQADPSKALDPGRLEALLHRSLALALFPEFLQAL